MKRLLTCFLRYGTLCSFLLLGACVTEVLERPPAHKPGLTIDWLSWPEEDLGLRSNNEVLELIAAAKKGVEACMEDSLVTGPVALQIRLRPDGPPAYRIQVAASSSDWTTACEERLHRGRDVRAIEKPQAILVRMTMRAR